MEVVAVMLIIALLASLAITMMPGTGRAKLKAVTMETADYHLARVSVEDQTERAEGKFDKSVYESTYVFAVFRRP